MLRAPEGAVGVVRSQDGDPVLLCDSDGSNVKGTQVGGMTASSPCTNGNIGVPGVKVLTSLTPPPAVPFVGGAEFDRPFASSTMQEPGCPDGNGDCVGADDRRGGVQRLTVFFNLTPAAAFYDGSCGRCADAIRGRSVYRPAICAGHDCPATASPFLGNTSLQDLYARASRDLLAMAGQTTALPPSTCTKAAPAPAISLVANAEGDVHVIAPNTWMEIKGSNLAAPGDSRIWQEPDFSGGLTIAETVGQRQRDGERQGGICLLHQPDASECADAARRRQRAGTGAVSYGGQFSASFSVQAQPLAPAFFVFGGGPYVAATHVDGASSGPRLCFQAHRRPRSPGRRS